MITQQAALQAVIQELYLTGLPSNLRQIAEQPCPKQKMSLLTNQADLAGHVRQVRLLEGGRRADC